MTTPPSPVRSSFGAFASASASFCASSALFSFLLRVSALWRLTASLTASHDARTPSLSCFSDDSSLPCDVWPSAEPTLSTTGLPPLRKYSPGSLAYSARLHVTRGAAVRASLTCTRTHIRRCDETRRTKSKQNVEE